MDNKMKNKMECCNLDNNIKEKRGKGILKGILYGLTPHVFCIAFVVFSILGATTATTLLKPLMLNPYFFYILVGLSLVFATVSAGFYLKRNKILSLQGAKRQWKYLSILYGTTILVNLIFFMVIFPLAANLKSGLTLTEAVKVVAGGKSEVQVSGPLITLQVEIPCSGHAPLIIGELEKINGVENVNFRIPNLFDVNYNSAKTSENKILALEIFKTYQAKIITRNGKS